MGTRNLTVVQHDGQYKLAQYGQWDGYPSGQGKTILEFLRDKFDREKFISRLNACKLLSDEEVAALDKDFSADDWTKLYPSLSRDTAAEVLEYIQESTEPVPIQKDFSFAGDSLFCEWAYVIDLDANMFEVYKGFNQTPVLGGSRFYDLQNKLTSDSTDKYYPVRLEYAWRLEALPTNEEFLTALNDIE